MQIFIMRHGEASMEAETDAQRPLTSQGQLEAELMGKWMEKMSLEFDAIWVSPYVRAQQTFSFVSKSSVAKEAHRTLSFITPSGSPGEVHDFIDGECTNGQTERLLIVSHMPLVSYLTSELTSHQQAPLFQTASVAEINYDLATMKGELVRMVSPVDLC